MNTIITKYDTDLDVHIKQLTRGMATEIENRIKKEIRERVNVAIAEAQHDANVMVENIARDMANEIVTKITHWHHLANDQINISLVVNKKEININE